MIADTINPDRKDFQQEVAVRLSQEIQNLENKKIDLQTHINRVKEELKIKQVLLCQRDDRTQAFVEQLSASQGTYYRFSLEFGYQVCFSTEIDQMRCKAYKLDFKPLDLRIFDIIRLKAACAALQGSKFAVAGLTSIHDIAQLLE